MPGITPRPASPALRPRRLAYAPAVALALVSAALATPDAIGQSHARTAASVAALAPPLAAPTAAPAAPASPAAPAAPTASPAAPASPASPAAPEPEPEPEPDAPSSAPPASALPPTSLPRCTARRAGVLVEAHLRVCPARVTAPVLAWQPDALVVLGGGVHPSGQITCSTMQRGWTAARLFETLGRRPALVLSGRGRRARPRPLDEAAVRCAQARWEAQAREAQGAGDATAAARARAAAQDVTTRRVARMTEAEHMCATVLRTYPREAWDEVLARVVFEPASGDTRENARRSAALLRGGGYERVLVVTSPGVRGPAPVSHAPRALAQFRRARAGAGYALAAIDCAFAEAGHDWLAFEPRRAARAVASTSSAPAPPERAAP